MMRDLPSVDASAERLFPGRKAVIQELLGKLESGPVASWCGSLSRSTHPIGLNRSSDVFTDIGYRLLRAKPFFVRLSGLPGA